MEIQFNKTAVPGLRTLLQQVQTAEQTQEVRLPEEMPDIGRVVACWGQPVIRGKEWHTDRVGVNGGVMCWVLYEPEGGGTPQSVAAWLPFQMKWEIPSTRHDGTIVVQPFLRSADARSLSARKLMVRAGVSVAMRAMVAEDMEIYAPGELPDDVRFLKKTYPMRLAQEAGEKGFQMEETFSVSGSQPQPERLIRYELRPELTDWKLMGDKVVFRGAAILHVLYRCSDGQLHNWDQEMSFSQYAELDKEYGDEASVHVLPIVTNLDLDLDGEGKLHLKAGLSGQYTVYGCPMIEVIEDAYSPKRSVAVQRETLQIPSLLDTQNRLVRVEQSVECEAAQVLDLAFSPDAPMQMRSDADLHTQLPGVFSLLYRDVEGNLQSTNAYWEETQITDTAPENQMLVTALPSGIPQAMPDTNGITMSADLMTDTETFSGQGIPMVTELALGEEIQQNPDRPSIVLRRVGNDTLWDIAKSTGSTVEAIMEANRLTGEPSPETIVLIPIA